MTIKEKYNEVIALAKNVTKTIMLVQMIVVCSYFLLVIYYSQYSTNPW